MDSNIVNLINEELKQSDLSFDSYMKIINDPKIKQALDKTFANTKEISSTDLNYYTNNPLVIEVIENYLFSKGINVIETNTYVTGRYCKDLDIEALYFKEISKTPLLSAKEEKELFTRLKYSTDEAEKKEIINRIVNANQRLVIKMAKKYNNRGLEFLDLVEEGNIGLLDAIDKFDIDLGYKFSTYSYWWIKQKITRAIADKGRIVRIPLHVHENLYKIHKIMGEYYDIHGTDMLLDQEAKQELASMLNISMKYLDSMLKIHAIISIDQPITKNCEDKHEIKDLVSAEGYNTEADIEEKMRSKEIRNMISTSPLKDREKDIIKMRYGIEYEREMTLDEVAKKYNLTSERIRQIQAKGQEKLKKYMIRKGYTL